MSKPASGENLQDDLSYLKRNGYTHIVSLLEKQEASELQLTSEEVHCKSLGLDFVQFPIPDRSVPEDKMAFINTVSLSYEAVLGGANLIAHCRAGIGRSGLYTLGVLLFDGHSAQNARELVSQARGLTIPDTEEQFEWIRENELDFRVPA
ncbi:MAG: protein-tyrosine phosphatase family protein [Pseudomonadota bacterium]